MTFFDFIDHWQGVIYLVGNFFFGWFIWSLKKQFASHDDLQKTKAEIKRLEERIATLPSTQSLHELSLKLVEMKGALNTANARFDGLTALDDRIQKQVDRMEEYLNRRGAK